MNRLLGVTGARRRLARRAVLAALPLLLAATAVAHAQPPADRLAVLRRGVNLTNWFRYPARQDAASIRAYIGESAIEDLRQAGFTFVRLAVQPEFLLGAAERTGLLAEAIARLQRHGLGVIVELHPTTWRLESVPDDRARLVATWRMLAPVLARFDPRLTFAEIVNEPVFTGDSAGWEALQREALATIRAGNDAVTVVLSGNDWSSLDGLLRLRPVADGNVVYGFHFYEPSVLTTLAGFQPGLDQAALARLPFPVGEPCPPGPAEWQTAAVMRYYCDGGWDEPKLRARIALAADWAHRNRVVVLAGEFGASDRLNTPARLAWLSAVRRSLQAQHLGWALWGYEDSMGLSVPRPPGARPRLNPEVLGALGLRNPS